MHRSSSINEVSFDKNPDDHGPAPTIRRRHVLALAGSAAAGGLATSLIPSRSAYGESRALKANPFTLGVASGDPLPTGVVLWTRLALNPVAEDGLGGMPQRIVAVQWQLAEDPEFRRVIRRGTVRATPAWAHSVHVEVDGLRAAREYWFRFQSGRHLSPIGRTKTAPAFDADVSEVRFAFSSCHNYQEGYFTALRYAAQENFDLMLHLGDYIYAESYHHLPDRSYVHNSEAFTLAEYRLRMSEYKTDPDLQAVHASTPYVAIFDDHDVENNWADDVSPDQDDPAIFLRRRAAAFRAYYENLPLRRSSMPHGPDMRIYRRLRYGKLVDFTMLDERQYRSAQLHCSGSCEERWDPKRTMLGAQQEEWLIDGMSKSDARWQVVGNQVVSFDLDHDAGPDFGIGGTDNWIGYAAARSRFYHAAVDAGVDNFVIVTGDAHRNAASNVRMDYQDVDSPLIGTEFLGTSVSTEGDGSDTYPGLEFWKENNPHVKFVNYQRGFQRVTVTKDWLQCDYEIVPYVSRPDAPLVHRATAIVENGRPGIAELRS